MRNKIIAMLIGSFFAGAIIGYIVSELQKPEYSAGAFSTGFLDTQPITKEACEKLKD